MISTNPYLHFKGNCDEALKFYETVLDAKTLFVFRAKDAPKEANCPPESGNDILHARVLVGQTVLMLSDCPEKIYEAPAGFSVNILVDLPEEADRIYKALSEGGKQTMPIAETFWAKRFGMCVDKFGTPWMVNCEKPAQ